MTAADTRTVRDSMGPMEVPADAYYGASTMRAVINFPISDWRFPRQFIRALGLIKLAAARANWDLNLLEGEVAAAIERAAEEVANGDFDAQFVVDIFQTGSGTSTNMNANEVIANRAGEILTGDRASGRVHPNDHVNLCQSSNDVIPAAIRVALLLSVRENLRPALRDLEASLRVKQEAFWDVIKTGRTHLQDATPVRLGQEFEGYAGQVERAQRWLDYAEAELAEVPLGGTAVGTGVNCHPDFARRVCAILKELTGSDFHEAENHFQAQSNIDGLVAVSGVLRTTALALAKIADDVRWMGSGPRAGLGELNLPEVQPGSSIMPGKVNPVIAEALLQACGQVLGNDAAVVAAGQGSHFELNMMLPVAGYNLLQSVTLLGNAARTFGERCIGGLEATSRGPDLVANGLAIATALAPEIGYDAAAEIAKAAAASGESVRAVALRNTTLSEAELDRILSPEAMTEPGL